VNLAKEVPREQRGNHEDGNRGDFLNHSVWTGLRLIGREVEHER
jgi:hypothetical protein